jgi:hypothetical protein
LPALPARLPHFLRFCFVIESKRMR